MEERKCEAFVVDGSLTVRGRPLQAGDPAPDFRLDYPDLADLVVRHHLPGGLKRIGAPDGRSEQPGVSSLPTGDQAVGNASCPVATRGVPL